MTIVRATFWTSLASTEDYRVMRNISVCADIKEVLWLNFNPDGSKVACRPESCGKCFVIFRLTFDKTMSYGTI